MTDDINLPATEEDDFSNDGIVAKDVTVQVISTAREEKENGTMYVIEFSSEELPFPIKVRAWSKHNNEVAQRIGRGTLKQIYKAALGEPKGSLEQLDQLFVKARLGEKDGFPNLTRFAKAESQVSLG